MKYSLRSLMFFVTLICVVLGGVMGRIEYLRRREGYHYAEFVKFNRLSLETASETEAEEWDRKSRPHGKLFVRYRKAFYRPWTLIDERYP